MPRSRVYLRSARRRRVLESCNRSERRRCADALDHVVTDRPRLARTPWRMLTSRPVYENRWIRVREDQVELPDGRTTIYGVVQCPGCVGVLPFLDPDTTILVGQYRYVAGSFYWEMPTGAVRPGETEEAAVQRELAEEAGYEADRLVKLCAFHPSKSVVEETANIYVAEGLRPVRRQADPTEFIEVRAFPFDEVVRMVERDEIKDSMTIIAVLHTARRRRQVGDECVAPVHRVPDDPAGGRGVRPEAVQGDDLGLRIAQQVDRVPVDCDLLAQRGRVALDARAQGRRLARHLAEPSLVARRDERAGERGAGDHRGQRPHRPDEPAPTRLCPSPVRPRHAPARDRGVGVRLVQPPVALRRVL